MKQARLSARLVVLGLMWPAFALGQQVFSVKYPTSYQESPRASSLHGSPFVSGPTIVRRPLVPPGQDKQDSAGPDAALQVTTSAALNVTPGAGFDGMSVYDGGYMPSDNNIAVGPAYIVEVVNAAFAVYDKSGNRLLGPTPMKNLWASLTGSACAANNGGDVVVQYDRAADRWMLTQMGSLSQPYSECIAVSKTSDPKGAYWLYSYGFGSNLNDYPKWSVWPTATNSAYLATYNFFANGSTFTGAQICAYDRAALLRGDPSPAALCYSGLGASLLPADLDGQTPPPDGTPAYFVHRNGNNLGYYTLDPNFANGTAQLSPYGSIAVASYSTAAASPQPGTTRTLDALSDRLMYRLAFRMFADHAALVVNHSVRSSLGNSGVRWYELRAPVTAGGALGSLSLYQQGTYAPDSSYRWMGSMAMDQAGNIALGYSVSSSAVYPSVRYTGRAPGDALGTMGAEGVIINGSGSQTGYSRWGDYSSMRIDPADDCTFWYVNEYLPATSSYGWYTRIGSFKFAGCGATSTDFTLAANPSSFTVLRGAAGNSTIAVTALNGYSASVSLSSTCPNNEPICAFTPSSVTPTGTSVWSVSPTKDTPLGSYPLTVTGTGGDATTHTVNVAVNVTDSCTVASLNPTALTIARGAKTASTVGVTVSSGSSGSLPVSLSVAGLPKGVSASFSPNPVNATTNTASTLSLIAARNATTGTKTVTVSGSANGTSCTAKTLTLTVK